MNLLELSKHFITIKSKDNNIYAYNSVFGNLTKLSRKELELIDKIKKKKIIKEKN